jgi:phosphate-selective porin OprO and OprP
MKIRRELSLIPVLLILLVFSPNGVLGQIESDERALIKIQDGISISDSLFMLNLRFRMQNRVGFNTISGDDLSISTIEARVRRLRLRFDGYVWSKKVRYYIQLAFSRADQDLETGLIAQTVRDAIIYYHFTDRFYIGFGQSKLPGNRQRVISSGNQQFADRSQANATFNIDRDFGLFAYYTQPMGNQRVNLKVAITLGEGRNALVGDDGLAYTGRIEWLPFGAFKLNNDFSEGDLDFETKPKLSIAGGYSFNERASRSAGQLGQPLFGSSDIGTLIIDALFKYRGWAVSAEFLQRYASNPITSDSTGLNIRRVEEGNGFNLQLSKMITKRTEVAARYTRMQPERSSLAYSSPSEDVVVGVSKYYKGHRIKMQLNAGYRYRDWNPVLTQTGNRWSGMFQVEFGI